ncbi:Ribosomal protein S35, mitochondrial [Metarhizium album ARSEF 1941]|uniref:Ribosomal protein S35, mitochondrial n=1 Tax=Metarhizium album (strain ARSEF 1941) TaxID=1081103 RepID=A0A0B2X3W0_METAS|nr:Ribosomal protein S35, mitochondrial [Metarhizium album ARSEF 1941]KHO00443.1 Ribosomal protein S35, mitochondrial [Metarhizium album ARSEF 1941]
MPPRINGTSALLAADVALPLQARSAGPFARTFSSTQHRDKMSRARQQMYQWLKSRDGQELAQGGRGPRYLGPLLDQPFPQNPLFRSQPVLDEQTRELIWEKITQRGESIKAVSAEMGVDVRRVAAVVRLVEVERQWVKDGKKLARPYAKAVMSMLPKTSYREGQKNEPHEPVNEVHVHKLTMQQLFVPVSESRKFTRQDAAKAFHETMLSADARSPQPQLIRMERDILKGMSREDSRKKFEAAVLEEEDNVARRLAQEQAKEEQMTRRVKTDRYEFRFREIAVDDVGRDGRSRKGTGWRYGAPFDDRKRGVVKIPTSVP